MTRIAGWPRSASRASREARQEPTAPLLVLPLSCSARFPARRLLLESPPQSETTCGDRARWSRRADIPGAADRATADIPAGLTCNPGRRDRRCALLTAAAQIPV